MKKSPALLLAAIVVSTCALGGCAAEPSAVPVASPTTSATPVETGPFPSGTVGAAHFDEGFVQIGEGPKTVDLFVDPLCPYCKLFEETSGQLLFDEAAAGRATIRIHPLAILNRLSQGTNYSSRAAAMFVAVAAESPDFAQQYFQALYDQQPSENTTGLTNDELRQIASTVRASTVSDGDLTRYQAWIDSRTQNAMTGPLDVTSEITAITQVPTVIVDEAVFPGNSNESAAFAAFYASAGK